MAINDEPLLLVLLFIILEVYVIVINLSLFIIT